MIDIILIILGIALLLIGFAGCILPVIPGPPISYLALLLLHFTSKYEFHSDFLILWAIIAVGITILDNVIPVWSTQKYGGSKKAVWGSALGLIAGLILFPPFGIIIGPFVGAVIGELIDGKTNRMALRSGFSAFIGFFFGIILKLIASGMITFYFFKALLQ